VYSEFDQAFRKKITNDKFHGTTAFFCFAAEAGDGSIYYPYADSGAGHTTRAAGKDVLATAQTGTERRWLSDPRD